MDIIDKIYNNIDDIDDNMIKLYNLLSNKSKGELDIINKFIENKENSLYILTIKARIYYLLDEYEKSFKLYENILSINKDNKYAINDMGNFYCFGKYVNKDFNKAREYYEKGCELNNSISFNNLGDLYYWERGVNQDYNKAKEYYEKGCELNNSSSFNRIGHLYYCGYGVDQNYNKAKEYYEKGCKLNNSDSFDIIGDLYYYGDGVDQDYNKAKEYYEKGCELNNSDSFNNLGDLYYYGRGLNRDYFKAVYYFIKAFALDNYLDSFKLKKAYEKLSIKDKRKCYNDFININNEEIKEILNKDFKIYILKNTINKIYENDHDVNILFNKN